MASREVSGLVPGEVEKTSGKAWGRVGKFISGKTTYPIGVFFIVGNEFCERFSYYGMRAILVTYLIDWLSFSENTATSIYHAFVVLCYFLPLLGAVLADGYIGKYRTILYLSIIYAAGNVLMSLSAFPPPFWAGPMIALFLIGLGTGGIKPCVSAFGGDQFPAEDTKRLAQFFSVFYFAINLGSVFSTIMTPLIRANVFCFGTNCFPLAFGIPAALMVVSLILFVLGRSMYRKYPPSGNVIGRMFGAITYASRRSCCKKGENADHHWLDKASDKYEEAFLNDVKCVLRVLLLFVPLPVFWALFDQQGSRWILQARSMDCYVLWGWQLPPELMQALNPILIISFIPLFEGVIYPLLDRCNLLGRPLQRMVAGMGLAVISFIVAGVLQTQIATNLDSTPAVDMSRVTLINSLPCTVNVNASWYSNHLGPQQSADELMVTAGNYSLGLVTETDTSCGERQDVDAMVTLESRHAYAVITSVKGGILQATAFSLPVKKSENGAGLVGVVYVSEDIPANHTLVVEGSEGQHSVTFDDVTPYEMTAFKKVKPGRYLVRMGETFGDIRVMNGASYVLTIAANSSTPLQLKSEFYEVEGRYGVSVFWQIPQYIIITASEILFSISGLSFAYSQAPASMKSVLQASWLMTVAFGNLLDMIITGVGAIPDQAVEFFVFACLMMVTTVVFAVMSVFYTYTSHVNDYEVLEDSASSANDDVTVVDAIPDQPDSGVR